MPSHEPLGSSSVRLLQKSRISAQAAVPVCDWNCNYVILLNTSSHFFFPLCAVSYLCFFSPFLFSCSVSVLVFLVFCPRQTLHMQSIMLGGKRRKYRKLRVKRVALLSPVSSISIVLLSSKLKERCSSFLFTIILIRLDQEN